MSDQPPERVGTGIHHNVPEQLLPPVFREPRISLGRDVAVPERRVEENSPPAEDEVGAVGQLQMGLCLWMCLMEPLLRPRPLAPDPAHNLTPLLARANVN